MSKAPAKAQYTIRSTPWGWRVLEHGWDYGITWDEYGDAYNALRDIEDVIQGAEAIYFRMCNGGRV